ncbi:MAG: hypothetical protein RL651_1508 [Pseudomonadota bacterium]|jgi:hypothetical protein
MSCLSPRAAIGALCLFPAIFSTPLHAQEAPDVQTQLTQIQASLQQMRTDYDQRIATLEAQVSQLKKENTQLASQARKPVATLAQAPSEGPRGSIETYPPLPGSKPAATDSAPAKTLSKAQQRVAKVESLEDKITAVAPPPAAAAPTPFPNLGGNDRTIDLGAELFLDAKYSSQSQNPENPYAGVLPNGAEGVPRGFSIGETELVFKGAVDNLFRGEARFVLEQEGNSTSIKTEELFAETLGLPGGTKVKAGKYWSSVGYLNDKHPHEWDFVDLPLVYKQVFGGQLNETGAQLSWIAPTDNMLFKFGGEIAQGSNGYGESFNSNYNQNKPRLGTLYAKTGGDIGDSHSWQGGLSWVRSTTGSGASANQATYTLSNTNDVNFTGGNTTWIADFVYRWAPFGNPTSQNLKIQGEMFWNKQSGSMTSNYNCAETEGQCLQGSNFAQNQQGFYTQGIYQFIPKWRAGYRYDRVFNGTNSFGLPAEALAGSQIQSGWDPYRNTIMMDWANSEYSLIRLQLARDNAFGPGIYNNAIYLQYIMSLGAHGSHKY